MKDEHDITLLSIQPDHIGEVTEMVGDAISRQAAVDLVEEVENKRLKGEIDLTYAPMIKGIKALPSAQLAQDLPNGCTDTISRQAAIDAIERLEIPEDMCVFEILSHIELEIGTLPSAQPEWKGKWVRYDGDWLKTMCKCSKCGAMIDINEKYRNFFCYHCGARMDGEQDE